MFKDKVCIVTGAASGIGLAIAQSFAQESAKVLYYLPPCQDYFLLSIR